jgi:hypothetical protein
MAASRPLEADVLVDSQVSADQEHLLVDAFGSLGVTARTRVVPPRRGVSELNWLVLVSLPLQAFLGSVGAKLADDAYGELKRLVGRLLHRDQPTSVGQRPMVLRDVVTGVQVVLEPNLPDEGYRQLFGLDLSEFQVGPVHYDRQEGRWRSELDEARRR